MTSPTTAAANAFVATHLDAAEALGHDLGALLDDPEAFVRRLHAGYQDLADPEYRAGQQFIAPGLTDPIGVRIPLATAIRRGMAKDLRATNPGSLLLLIERLLRDRPSLEQRLLAIGLLERTVEPDPERSWQLLRDVARQTHEWITVDALAHPFGKGILAEPVRWAEIEQLAYSPSRWERRLVGSTIATIPFVNRSLGRRPEVAARALPILANLIGDADADVQKALSWALRSTAIVDRRAVEDWLDAEASRAAQTGDGHRAWVIRDALVAIDPDRAAAIRARLAGIRRRAGAPSTSRAAATAMAFFGTNPDLEQIVAAPGPRQGIRQQLAGGTRR
jgi:3-methyladenine DNA glycosylase AlkD